MLYMPSLSFGASMEKRLKMRWIIALLAVGILLIGGCSDEDAPGADGGSDAQVVVEGGAEAGSSASDGSSGGGDTAAAADTSSASDGSASSDDAGSE